MVYAYRMPKPFACGRAILTILKSAPTGGKNLSSRSRANFDFMAFYFTLFSWRGKGLSFEITGALLSAPRNEIKGTPTEKSKEIFLTHKINIGFEKC